MTASTRLQAFDPHELMTLHHALRFYMVVARPAAAARRLHGEIAVEMRRLEKETARKNMAADRAAKRIMRRG